MSTENPNPGVDKEAQPGGEGNPREEFVSVKVAEDYKNDMFKYKDRAKAERAEKEALRLKLEEIERSKLEEKQEYQKLYEQAKQEKEKLIADVQSERTARIDSNKKIALKQELGSVNDVYLSHARLSEIEVNEDGTLNSESVKSVANKFREEHPALLPQSKSSSITNPPPAGDHSPEETFEQAMAKVGPGTSQAQLDAILKKYNRI